MLHTFLTDRQCSQSLLSAPSANARLVSSSTPPSSCVHVRGGEPW